jgi:hypothetical protein
MPLPFTALALSAVLLVGAIDGVPHFDPRKGCQAGADSGVDLQPNVDGCVASEMQARSSLVGQWKSFRVADRTNCVDETSMGGPPSYIEVLTCLEIARDGETGPHEPTKSTDTIMGRSEQGSRSGAPK